MNSADFPTTYYALEERQIRLMRIDYYSNDDTCIKCELRTFPLAELPSYVALSYCWTKQPPSVQIKLNSGSHWIRPNLHKYLQLMVEERQQCWVFVDALCINQADLTERANQVELVADVYSSAQEVVAWLGMPPETLLRPKKFDRYDEIVSKVQALLSSEEEMWDVLIGAEDADTVLAMGVFMRVMLLGSEYWSRMWIVQEILMAPKFTLRVERLHVREEQFETALRYLTKDRPAFGFAQPLATSTETYALSTDFLGITNRKKGKSSAWLRLLANFQVAIMLMRARRENSFVARNPSLGPALCDLILTYAGQGCSETYDKVFGLLRLTRVRLKTSHQMSRLELFLRVYTGALLEQILAVKTGNQREASRDVVMKLFFKNTMMGAQLLYHLQLSPHHPVVAVALQSILENVMRQFGPFWTTFQLWLTSMSYQQWLSSIGFYFMWISLGGARTFLYRYHALWLVPKMGIDATFMKGMDCLLSNKRDLSLWWCDRRRGTLSSPSDPADSRTIESWCRWADELSAEIADNRESELDMQIEKQMRECAAHLEELRKIGSHIDVQSLFNGLSAMADSMEQVKDKPTSAKYVSKSMKEGLLLRMALMSETLQDGLNRAKTKAVRAE